MTTTELLTVLNRIEGKLACVVGDVFLDVYLGGEARGMSPEAPVPLVELRGRRCAPGAAAHVAATLAALGASVELSGAVGHDADGEVLREMCREAGVGVEGVVAVTGMPTNVRTRISAGDGRSPERPVLRVDTAPPPVMPRDAEAALIARLQHAAHDADALVVIEGPPGVCAPGVLAAARRTARDHDLLLIGDAFGQADSLRGYDVVLPNEREAGTLVGIEPVDEETLGRIGEALVSQYDNAAAAITRGPEGIALFTSEGRLDVPTTPREVFDVTAAGDTGTGAFAAAMLGGADLAGAAQIANAAAWVAVGRPQATIVTADDLRHAIAELTVMERGGKLHSREELAARVRAAQARGKRVAFTNGCFDIIHPGHVIYLQQARDVADALIVALNSDSSVRALKGPSRPILNQDERTMILSALESVTWVTVFDETRVTSLLRELRPDVWVKGGDYTVETLDAGEREAAQDCGIEIALIPPVEGISTTDIVRRIEQGQGPDKG